ncbi:MAG: sugar ABC transporter permease [Proteobacteria bacterium]|nr:sugar ABC transporter permease [Pseudomonadota bacterium]
MSGAIRGRGRAYLAGLLPPLLVLFVLTVAPGLFLFATSLTPATPLRPGSLLDFSDPFRNYIEAFADGRFINSLVIQVKLSAATVVLQVAIGLGLALLLNARDRWLEFMRSAFLIPMVLPPIVVGILWKVLYTPEISPVHRLLDFAGFAMPSLLGRADTALVAIVIAETWEWFPFTLLLLLAALQMIPDEPIEAAIIDGAGRWQIFRYVVLPYIFPTLIVAALFRLIDSLKAFPLIYVLTGGGPGTATEVTNFYAFQQSFNYANWGYGSAIATLIVAGSFALSMIVSRLSRRDFDAS